ncbi:MAG: hypothetical protein HC906_00510 [Bacteroidales bacterium]|nr:hypothetical protein [Bacteroidales bacterium]
MIVFTADRPAEWIDQADGQTVRQFEVYRNHVKQSLELPVETADENDLWYSNRLVSQAIVAAMQSPAGPVHINVPLREPLYGHLPERKSVPVIDTVGKEVIICHESMGELAGIWNKSQKKMIVCGFQNPSKNTSFLLDKLANRNDTVVIAENLSNIAGSKFIYAPERLFAGISDNEKEHFQPEIIITIGNSVISKRLKQFLRLKPVKEHWHIDANNSFIDTYKNLTKNIPVTPEVFLSHF